MPHDEDRAPLASLRHLLGRLAVVEARARRAEQALADDGEQAALTAGLQRLLTAPDGRDGPPDDPDTAALLARVEAAADDAEQAGAVLRLRRLARRFGLSPLDLDLLLVALAPEVDTRFEVRYRRLSGEPAHGSGRASPGLALRLCLLPAAAVPARERLVPGAPLVDGALLKVLDRDRPWLSRPLTVSRRVVEHLLGHDPPDPRLAPVLTAPPATPGAAAKALMHAIDAGCPLAYVQERRGALGAGAAVAALEALGGRAVVLDASRLPGADDLDELATAAARDARLRGAGLIVDRLETLDPRDPVQAQLVRTLAALPGIVVLVGRGTWDPTWSRRAPVLVAADPDPADVRATWWEQQLGADRPADLDLTTTTRHFDLDPAQIRSAVGIALNLARAGQRPVSSGDLQRGARAQNGAGLERLGRRVEPRAGFDDLVLAEEALSQLHHLVTRWRERDTVLDDWGMARGGVRGRGVTALFAGDSGTGKTLSAEILAGALGLDLYIVELSTVIDKYVGETAKNLERIFVEADRVNGVLLFDEADALFGKRSAVSDAQDRHANVEVAYLLQRMESFDGVAVLTTNLAANLDEAFLRRLDVIIDFPSPDPGQRRRLWAAKLPPGLPRADDLDLDELAERFPMSGSEIENTAISAAFEVAAEQRALTMDDLVRAIVREHRKVGRHLTAADLGPFAESHRRV